MIYIAFTLFLISLAICGWFTFAFLAWSGPSEAEVDSYLDGIEENVRAFEYIA